MQHSLLVKTRSVKSCSGWWSSWRHTNSNNNTTGLEEFKGEKSLIKKQNLNSTVDPVP